MESNNFEKIKNITKQINTRTLTFKRDQLSFAESFVIDMSNFINSQDLSLVESLNPQDDLNGYLDKLEVNDKAVRCKALVAIWSFSLDNKTELNNVDVTKLVENNMVLNRNNTIELLLNLLLLNFSEKDNKTESDKNKELNNENSIIMNILFVLYSTTSYKPQDFDLLHSVKLILFLLTLISEINNSNETMVDGIMIKRVLMLLNKTIECVFKIKTKAKGSHKLEKINLLEYINESNTFDVKYPFYLNPMLNIEITTLKRAIEPYMLRTTQETAYYNNSVITNPRNNKELSAPIRDYTSHITKNIKIEKEYKQLSDYIKNKYLITKEGNYSSTSDELYEKILPIMNKLVTNLIKILYSTIKSQERSKNKEIVRKSTSLLILQILKIFKKSNYFQFEYICSLFIEYNLFAVVLKYLESDQSYLDNNNTDNYMLNKYKSILNLIHIMYILSRNKYHISNKLVNSYKTHIIMKKMLKYTDSNIQFYSLKLINNLAPLINKKWKHNNVKITTLIYTRITKTPRCIIYLDEMKLYSLITSYHNTKYSDIITKYALTSFSSDNLPLSFLKDSETCDFYYDSILLKKSFYESATYCHPSLLNESLSEWLDFLLLT